MHSTLHYKVLVVEDNPDLAANLVDYLSAHDCVVDVSGDGLEALHLATTQSFDVILLDLMLPGIGWPQGRHHGTRRFPGRIDALTIASRVDR